MDVTKFPSRTDLGQMHLVICVLSELLRSSECVNQVFRKALCQSGESVSLTQGEQHPPGMTHITLSADFCFLSPK